MLKQLKQSNLRKEKNVPPVYFFHIHRLRQPKGHYSKLQFNSTMTTWLLQHLADKTEE
jgi:hypothetical protein